MPVITSYARYHVQREPWNRHLAPSWWTLSIETFVGRYRRIARYQYPHYYHLVGTPYHTLLVARQDHKVLTLLPHSLSDTAAAPPCPARTVKWEFLGSM